MSEWPAGGAPHVTTLSQETPGVFSPFQEMAFERGGSECKSSLRCECCLDLGRRLKSPFPSSLVAWGGSDRDFYLRFLWLQQRFCSKGLMLKK